MYNSSHSHCKILLEILQFQVFLDVDITKDNLLDTLGREILQGTVQYTPSSPLNIQFIV